MPEGGEGLEQQQQLTKAELECIYRHLKMFVFKYWDREENTPDACAGCNHYCSKDRHTFDPWKAFYKLSSLVDRFDGDNPELEQRIAALEGQVQTQRKEIIKALAFLFDRNFYKELAKANKLTYPGLMTEAVGIFDHLSLY